MTEFETTNFILIHYFLGIEVRKMNDGIFISQGKYTTYLLHKWEIVTPRAHLSIQMKSFLYKMEQERWMLNPI